MTKLGVNAYRDDFRDYAKLCVWEFGDRVKKWATLNEPTTYIISGYVLGKFPPGRGITVGDPGREPYCVAHNLLLAHAEHSKRKDWVVLATMWAESFHPKDDSHIKAALRALDFGIGWFMEPITTGQYPASMIKYVEDRLPTFKTSESRQLIGSCDFVGINYYTAKYIINASSTPERPSYITDGHFGYASTPIGPLNGSTWINVYPIGLYKLLTYIQKTYNDPLLYLSFDFQIIEARKDKWRTEYLQDHLLYIQLALEVGVKVKGYFAWSLLDNFEWDSGYTSRFGIIHIDYSNGLARYPKESALWYMNFLHYAPTKRQIEESDEIDQGPLKKLKM
ncbi:unnamed protein product [Ilex paraguariensis]|uniref:Beta-glucosidase n=1 Tax=Ilex paraguariensis TaxID=185542 RepID=A0ABC8S3L6_9AQUA